jgi:DNA repair protein RecO (recombination protein O)
MSAAKRPAAALSAFMLRRHDWSETSLIVELFSREQGRIVVAAKGAKRPYSQLRSVLLPFQRIQVSLGRASVDPQSEIQTLRSAEWGGLLAPLSGSGLFAGFYLNELLTRMLARQDPHARLFDAYAATLTALVGTDEAQSEAPLRAFELVLLRECGLLPELGVVTSTQQAVCDDAFYRLDAESGLVVAPGQVGQAGWAGANGAGLGGADCAAIQRALADQDGAGLTRACAKALPALKSQLRGLLQYQLGAQPLRTRQVMVEVQRLLETQSTPALSR